MILKELYFRKSNKIKQLILFLPLFLILLIVFCQVSCKNSRKEGKNNFKSAKWEITSIKDGTVLTKSQIEGKVAVLHFFASWCPPCVAEFPQFVKWEQANNKKDSFLIIPISLDRSKSAANSFIIKHDPLLNCYFDKGDAADFFKIDSIPTTLVIDHEGNIVFAKSGAVNWESGEIDKVLTKIKS